MNRRDIMKIVWCISMMLCIGVLVFTGCKKNELEKKEFTQLGKRIDLPEEYMGINFCTLTAKDILEQLQKAGASYTIFDNDTEKEITFDGNYDTLTSTISIVSNYFIGQGIPQEMIIESSYDYIPIWDSFNIWITIKEEYYAPMLEKLKKQFGYENARVNTMGYGEVEWSSGTKEDCIDWVTMSRKFQGGHATIMKEGAFFLEIRMRGRIEDCVH